MPSVRSSTSTSRLALFALAGAVALLLVLELLLRLFPVASATHAGYYVAPRILTYPPGHRFTIATGWDLRNAHTHTANNFGFLARHDFVRNPDAVALIGDSFIEANMLAPEARVDAHLESLLGRPVYAMGGPGSSLLDYAERVRFAVERFAIHDFVLVIERYDVPQTLCGSNNVHGPCVDPRTLRPRTELMPRAGALKSLMRESALAQYLFSQLRFDPARVVANLRATVDAADATPRLRSKPRPTDWRQQTEAVIDAFLAALPRDDGIRYTLLFDADRKALANGDRPTEPGRARLMARCREAGLTVVDLAPVFARHLAASPLALEVGPYDAHWNSLATRLVAEAAHHAMAERPAQAGDGPPTAGPQRPPPSPPAPTPLTTPRR